MVLPGLASSTRWRAVPLLRNRSDRLVLGVASGLARQIGVEPIVLRIAFCLLLAPYGIGAALYVILYLASHPAHRVDIVRRLVNKRRTAGACVNVVGLLVIANALGVGPLARPAISVALMTSGALVVWARSDDDDRTSTGSTSWVVVGVVLFLGGAADLSQTLEPLSSRQATLLTAGVLFCAVIFLVAPWIVRLSADFAEERRARVRSEERAELSAQLHDSVLQTLALIARSDSLSEVTDLARRQERELRAWMLGSDASPTDLLSAVRATATEVESTYDVRVDVVGFGEVQVDDRLRALVDAAREAIVNAARHSGSADISVYVEISHDAVTLFVRDDGRGFDKERIHPQRRGLRESIVGRMERVEGVAHVRTAAGAGTEVELRVPRTVR